MSDNAHEPVKISLHGYLPRRHPEKVQGGYVPAAGRASSPPPTGGSGVKPAEKK